MDLFNISLKNLADYLSQELRKRDIEAIFVGGACVTIYSKNRYQSYDLDFATYEDMRSVTNAMKELGFHVQGRHFEHPDCPWMVEFVSPPIAIGNQPIEHFNRVGSIKLLTPGDSVKDRLVIFFHWNDRQGLEQAIQICQTRKVNLSDIEKWAIEENHQQKFQEFLDKLDTL